MNASPNTSRRILVIDDEPLSSDSIKRILVHGGYAVTVAPGAEQALNLDLDVFDLAITDYEMPRMRGDALAVAIKKRKPELPVMIVTGYLETLQHGDRPVVADLLIAKPFGVLDFLSTVGNLLKRT